MLGAFFDDSGTHAGSPVVALGGLLGTDGQWDEFAAAWETLLASPLDGKPSLRAFHLTHLRNGYGEFLDYSQADRDRINYLFRRIIVDLDMISIAAAVDARAWDELIRGDVRELVGDSFGFCFNKCMDLMLNSIRARYPSEKVWTFFDAGLRNQVEGWARFYAMQKNKYPEIDRFVFAPVPKVVALQGADLIATETFYYAQEWLKDGPEADANPHFREFLQRPLSAGVVLNRTAIADVVEQIKSSHLA